MTQFLDLDAVQPKVDFALGLNGKKHVLKPASVETFISNMEDLKKLGVNADAIDEMKTTVTIVQRAFPSIKREELMALTLDQVKAISDFARKANGEIVENEADVAGQPAEGEAASEGNGETAN